MQYAKAALVGLVGGVLLFVAAMAVEVVIAQLWLAKSMYCGVGFCEGYVQFRHVSSLGSIAFPVGFTAAFAWSLRRHRRVVT